MSSVGEVWTRPVPPGVTEESLDAASDPFRAELGPEKAPTAEGELRQF